MYSYTKSVNMGWDDTYKYGSCDQAQFTMTRLGYHLLLVRLHDQSNSSDEVGSLLQVLQASI